MSKKKYQSPRMKVVEFEVEQHLLAASTQAFTVGETTYGDSDFDD